MKTILVSITVLLAAALGSDAAFAKTVSIAGNSKTKVEGRCNESGGVYWTGKTGNTYGSMNPDGGGIACSGVTSAQKKTCETFRQAPVPHFPTREEAAKGGLATK